jgi:hypothetical protein
MIDEQTQEQRAQQHEADLQAEEAACFTSNLALALERPASVPIVAPERTERVRDALRSCRAHHPV